jgi:hypothetical protein
MIIKIQIRINSDSQQFYGGGTYSEWSQLLKGVPRGSILDPVLFNVFINDIFLFVKDSTIYNYADDNTVYGYRLKFVRVSFHKIE